MPQASSIAECPALFLLGCLLASSVNGQPARDPEKLLAEADRLAFMRLWTRAEPLYDQARTAFVNEVRLAAVLDPDEASLARYDTSTGAVRPTGSSPGADIADTNGTGGAP